MMSRVAAIVAALILIGVALFQVALVLGAPWGEFTQGGANTGSLPSGPRVVAGFSAVLLGVMAGSLLARVGIGPMVGLPRRITTVLAWFTVVYSGLGVVLNLATPSEKERLVWAPVTAVVAVLALIAVIGSRGTRTLEAASRSGDRG